MVVDLDLLNEEEIEEAKEKIKFLLIIFEDLEEDLSINFLQQDEESLEFDNEDLLQDETSQN